MFSPQFLYRDFAYVARDKVTKRYKCHVFRCDIPAKAIANALHEICARVMSERQKGHTISMVTQGQMIQQQQQQQLMQMRSISLDSNKEGIPTSGRCSTNKNSCFVFKKTFMVYLNPNSPKSSNFNTVLHTP